MPYKNRDDLYAAQKRHRLRIRAQVLEYLSHNPCIDCGEKDPVVLDFDHRDSNNKFKMVARMLAGHYGWDMVKNEINKCDVRCANCHRRRTYVQLGCFGKNKPL